MFLQLSLIGTDSEMKKIAIFIYYEEWHISLLKLNKKMSTLVFLFLRILKKVLSSSGFFYCFGGLQRKPIVLHVEISIFWATPSNVIFPNRPCFCFDIQIEFQHFLVTCTFLLLSHKINQIFGFTIMCYIWHKNSYLDP